MDITIEVVMIDKESLTSLEIDALILEFSTSSNIVKMGVPERCNGVLSIPVKWHTYDRRNAIVTYLSTAIAAAGLEQRVIGYYWCQQVPEWAVDDGPGYFAIQGRGEEISFEAAKREMKDRITHRRWLSATPEAIALGYS